MRDEDWLSEVGKREWIVLTKDDRIRYRPVALATIRRAKVRTFTLPRADLTGEEMAKIFVKALPAITRFVARNPAPFIAKVTSVVSLTLLYIWRF